MTAVVSSSCNSPMARWFSAKNAGAGQPHIICPMEKYISTSKKPRDQRSRCFKTGVSRSERASSDAGAASAAASFKEAP